MLEFSSRYEIKKGGASKTPSQKLREKKERRKEERRKENMCHQFK